MQKKSSLSVYVESSVYGAVRALAGLPFEHPFDTVKTMVQTSAMDQKVSAINTAKRIWSEKGPLGFYRGYVPNSVRVASKQVYRYPLMLVLPGTFARLTPSVTLRKTMTGISIAVLEVGIITPLERLKVWIMTNNKTQSSAIRAFLSSTPRGSLAQELFRGFTPCITKQVVSWTSFLVADAKFKEWTKQYLNTNQLTYWQLVGVGSAVGVANTLTIMPFDMLKTQYQQFDSKMNSMSMRAAFRTVYAKGGVASFYAGFWPRMIQYVINGIFTVSLLDYLESKII